MCLSDALQINQQGVAAYRPQQTDSHFLAGLEARIRLEFSTSL
jgi:hypothetical protein